MAVTIDGRHIRHDHLHESGWDFTNDARAEPTLFGTACAELADGEGPPTAVVEHHERGASPSRPYGRAGVAGRDAVTAAG